MPVLINGSCVGGMWASGKNWELETFDFKAWLSSPTMHETELGYAVEAYRITGCPRLGLIQI